MGYWVLPFVSGMKQIENLEKELEMAKRKSAQLASYLETKRKQKIMKQPTETVW